MRLITLSLALLLVLIQIPLWQGKGGWLRVWDLDKQVAAAQKKNADLKARNAKLASEVQDLTEGTDAVEERARFHLGMIKDGEVFVQVVDQNAAGQGLQFVDPPVAPSKSGKLASPAKPAKPVKPQTP